MNITSSQLRHAAIPLLALALAGCAAVGAGDRQANQSAMGTQQAPASMQGQQGMMMDMQAMCDMHKQHMAGKSPQERQAMMDEHMRSMPADMRNRMQSMMKQCQ